MPRQRHKPRYNKGRRTRSPTLLNWLVVAIVLVITAAAYLLLRPASTLPEEISASKAHELYQAGASFIDVRTVSEWDRGHIAGSSLIPLDDLPDRLNEVPRDKDVVVVCTLGVRSKEGAAILRQAGLTRVTCLSGGLEAWAAAGYAVEQ
jgi:rhodanese-related sulfurtransferase